MPGSSFVMCTFVCASAVVASMIFSLLYIFNWDIDSLHRQVAVSDDEAKQERNCGKRRTKSFHHVSGSFSGQANSSRSSRRCSEVEGEKSTSLFYPCKEEVFIYCTVPCFDSPSRRRRDSILRRTLLFSIGYPWGRIYTIIMVSSLTSTSRTL